MEQTFKQQVEHLLKERPARSVSSRLNYMYPTFDVGEGSNFERVINHSAKHLKELRHERPHAPMVHIGFASFINLDILAEGKHEYAILCDYNRQTAGVWNEMFTLIRSSNSPEEFKTKLRDAFPHKEKLWRTRNSGLLKTGKWMAKHTIADPGDTKIEDYFAHSHWLRDQESFERIKGMVEEERIATVTMDALDRPRMEKLGNWLSAQNYTVATLYASNIGYYLAPAVDESINSAASMEATLHHAYKSGPDAEHILLEKTHGYHQERLPKNPSHVFQKNLKLLAGANTMVFHASKDKEYGMPGAFPLIIIGR